MAKAKPFIKWVGGKGQLIEQLEALLPADFAERDNVTYIEPFVGGGAMLFYMLQTYPNIKSAVINDINPELINLYENIRDNCEPLIQLLEHFQTEYLETPEADRQNLYLGKRATYNHFIEERNPEHNLEKAALFIYLNKTCFNGLYRVNRNGLFNVPFNRAKNLLFYNCVPAKAVGCSALRYRSSPSLRCGGLLRRCSIA